MSSYYKKDDFKNKHQLPDMKIDGKFPNSTFEIKGAELWDLEHPNLYTFEG